MEKHCNTCKWRFIRPNGIWCWFKCEMVTKACNEYDDREPGSEG